MQPLLTDADVARAFRTTPQKISRLAKSAGLPHVAVPSVGLRFLPNDVERWIRERQQQPKGNHE